MKARRLLKESLEGSRNRRKLIKQLENWCTVKEAVKDYGYTDATYLHKKARAGRLVFIDFEDEDKTILRLLWRGQFK